MQFFNISLKKVDGWDVKKNLKGMIFLREYIDTYLRILLIAKILSIELENISEEEGFHLLIFFLDGGKLTITITTEEISKQLS